MRQRRHVTWQSLNPVRPDSDGWATDAVHYGASEVDGKPPTGSTAGRPWLWLQQQVTGQDAQSRGPKDNDLIVPWQPLAKLSAQNFPAADTALAQSADPPPADLFVDQSATNEFVDISSAQ